ncbi:hypothetical protein LINGRAHAP2_LOCUS30492 [Linum grandiflorum]
MGILCWNCRGLDMQDATRVLKDLVTTHKPDIVMLIVTFAEAQQMKNVRGAPRLRRLFRHRVVRA